MQSRLVNRFVFDSIERLSAGLVVVVVVVVRGKLEPGLDSTTGEHGLPGQRQLEDINRYHFFL